ncbi:MAG: hypothetical protein K9N10_12890 [Deltaproteobacteria bacterium]|nr:hypothetical protein [Deltaproteobacteria bacterium]
MLDFFQKALFLSWADQNSSLFDRAPLILEEGDGYAVFGFAGVTRQISCCMSARGDITIQATYRNRHFDILMDFDLCEEQTLEARWICKLCRDWPNPEHPEPFVEYTLREELWIKHSFEPLATWTRENFQPGVWLCLFRTKGASWASLRKGIDAKEVETQPELLMKVPVLVSG